MPPTIQFGFVEYRSNGDRVSAYLARPEGPGPFPGIVVIMEWWGLEPHILDVANRFAREGYLALAPDVYHGRLTADGQVAMQWLQSQNQRQMVQELTASVRYLKQQPFCNGKVGTIGYCMGGGLSLATGCATPEVDAVISYYGSNPDPVEQVRDIRGPILSIYGETDAWLFPAHANALRDAARRFGKSCEVHSYPGAPHAFFNDTHPEVYRPEASQDAWQKTLAFCNRVLR